MCWFPESQMIRSRTDSELATSVKVYYRHPLMAMQERK